MSRALPSWAQGIAPVDMDGAAILLGVSAAELRKVLIGHPYYEARGPRKKVFYPGHIRKLTYVLSPPLASTPLEIIQNHVASHLEPSGLAQWEQFITQPFDGLVYLIRCNDRIKIGFTTHWTRRFRVLKTACPYPVTVISVMPGNRLLEQFLHVGFSSLRAHGEWFEERGELSDLIVAIEALPK